MAKEKAEALFVQGNPVVGLDTENLQLGPGELSDEHREKLGDLKVESLQKSGYLKSQEQLAAEDRQRLEAESRKSDPFEPNPNFGTPSMTAEAIAKRGQDTDPAPKHARRRDNFLETPIAELSLPANTAKALTDAGMTDISSILAYGAEKPGGLKGLKGLDEKGEAAVQAAITRASKGQK